MPKMIAYSATPNPYFNDKAQEVAKIYDGFFFVIGSWDGGVIANLGLGDGTPTTTDWKEKVRENLIHLRSAGVTENLLGVYFGSDDEWPSPKTLLSEEYKSKIARHFAAIGREAKELGFRGVSIDVEYPFPRFELDHEIYTYNGYTQDDLLKAAKDQGRTTMAALLDEFPDVVVFVLPGYIWARPIARNFMSGMLEVTAERDAPGGFHLASERAYSLLDPVSQVALSREGDLSVLALVNDPKILDYWKRRCTVAPGVWPLHMVETGGRDYPVRPWAQELEEIKQQMGILRVLAKRYMWSFSGQPLWYKYTPELEEKYGLKRQKIDATGMAQVLMRQKKGSLDVAIEGWHAILQDKSTTNDPKILKLIVAVQSFDKGELDAVGLCNKLGTPCEWLVLGLLGNPFIQPEFAAPDAIHGQLRLNDPVRGRDGDVRWFRFRNHEPLGAVRLIAAFDWGRTDKSSAHIISSINSPAETDAYLLIAWDDGVAVWLNDKLIFDHLKYPEYGHGAFFRDRYDFEEKIPIKIPEGESRLAITCVNLVGSWALAVRIVDKDGFPIEGLTFSIPSTQ
ncbi:MAG: hypothetical protein AB1546_05160 [bacterium]